MKIGFDAKRVFQNFTGLGNYSRFIIKTLIENLPQHEYCLYHSKKSGVKSQELGVSDELLSIKTPNFSFLTPNSLWRSWLITNDLQKDNIQVYHGLSNEIPFGISKSGVKSVVTIHDLIFERYPHHYPTIDRFFYRKKFKYACQNADAVVAISEQTKQDIIDFYGIPSDRIVVIYQDCQPIFKEKIALETQQRVLTKYGLQKPYILCVASFSERKNQKMLIEAFKKLQVTDYDLVLIGGKSAYAEQLEKHPAVRILYGIPNEDLPALYQAAKLFVYPSIFEGFGIPIIEALYSDVPVVAATGSCLEEAGGEGALYANPLDSNDLAQKIELVLNDNHLRKTLILNGKKHLDKFAPSTIAQQLNLVYESV